MLIANLVLVLIVTACSTAGSVAEAQVAQMQVTREVAPPVDNLPALVAGNTEFAFDLYHQIAAEQDGNLIFSPHSISMAFAMVYAGARGETATQMADTLHYMLPLEQLHPAFNALDLALTPPEKPLPTPTLPRSFNESPADDLALNIANGLWRQEGYSFEQAYLDTLGLNYGAELGLVDFSTDPAGAQRAISQWVEEATEGRIKNMPPPEAITPQTRLVLANAIYFKGEWTWPFNEEKTQEGTFHLQDGSEITVPMMVSASTMKQCGQGDGYYAIRLTYGQSENVAMLILLPDEGKFQDFERTLDTKLFTDTLAGLEDTNALIFSMPRFKFESEVDLHETLSGMGMTAPFGEGADFTGMSASGGLSVGYAGHKATISVDEQGTEATGATVVMTLLFAALTGCDNEVTVDRPFVFAIYDVETGAILFLGRVMNPAVGN
jgi:serpin B